MSISRDDLQQAAQAYLSAELCVLPAILAEKRPAVGRWKQYQKRLPTPDELSAWMEAGPDAVCIVCGMASDHAEIIDFDGGGELFEAWWDRIPDDLRERLVMERTPSGGYHVIYRCAEPICGNLKLAQRRDGEKIVTLIETRGEGGLFLCAPTPGYEVIQGDLANPPVLTAEERDSLLQAALDLNEYVPQVIDGPTHIVERPTDRPGDDFNRRGDVGEILRAHGWIQAKGGENEYWRRPGKESGTSATLKDRVFYVFSSNAAPFEPNRGYSPFAVYAMLNHGGDFQAASRSLRLSGYGDPGPEPQGSRLSIEQAQASGWPDPLPLDATSPPDMPSGVLSGWWGDMVEALSDATETPLDLPALLSLPIVGAAVQGKYSVMPERGYFEPLCIWAIPALDPGTRKTAVLAELRAPLVEWEREAREEAKAEIEAARLERDIIEGRIAHLKGKAAKTGDAEARKNLLDEIKSLDASMPPEPIAPRLFTQDVTAEHLGTMMAQQGGKMAVLTDEGGLFDLMAGRYSSGIPNLDIWLQSHSGSSCRVDRGSRAAVILDHPMLSVAMSPQPEVLKRVSAKPEFRGRGLLARCLFGLPASPLGNRTLEPRPIPDEIRQGWRDAILALLAKAPAMAGGREVPHVLKLDDLAYGIWKDEQRRIEILMGDGQAYAGMRDWAGKLPGAIARIAGLMHCAAHADCRPEDAKISDATMGPAVRWGQHLADHALAVFDLMGGGLEAEARRVWERARAEGVDEITVRELWIPHRSQFKTMTGFRPVLDLLCEYGYLAKVPHPKREGRPSQTVRLNPNAR